MEVFPEAVLLVWFLVGPVWPLWFQSHHHAAKKPFRVKYPNLWLLIRVCRVKTHISSDQLVFPTLTSLSLLCWVLQLTWVFLAPCFSFSVCQAVQIAEGGALIGPQRETLNDTLNSNCSLVYYDRLLLYTYSHLHILKEKSGDILYLSLLLNLSWSPSSCPFEQIQSAVISLTFI